MPLKPNWFVRKKRNIVRWFTQRALGKPRTISNRVLRTQRIKRLEALTKEKNSLERELDRANQVLERAKIGGNKKKIAKAQAKVKRIEKAIALTDDAIKHTEALIKNVEKKLSWLEGYSSVKEKERTIREAIDRNIGELSRMESESRTLEERLKEARRKRDAAEKMLKSVSEQHASATDRIRITMNFIRATEAETTLLKKEYKTLLQNLERLTESKNILIETIQTIDTRITELRDELKALKEVEKTLLAEKKLFMERPDIVQELTRLRTEFGTAQEDLAFLREERQRIEQDIHRAVESTAEARKRLDAVRMELLRSEIELEEARRRQARIKEEIASAKAAKTESTSASPTAPVKK